MVREHCYWNRKEIGLLIFGIKPNGVLEKMDKTLVKAGVVFQRLNTEQLRTKFPMMSFDGEFDAIYEPTGGVLKADSILQVYQRLFKKDGGIVNDGEKVESITPGDVVTVKTSRDTYKARSVVIATGPWFASLLKPLGIDLPLRPERSRVCFWKQKTRMYSPNAGFPCVFMTQQDPDEVVSHNYAIPAIEYPNHVKVCLSSDIMIDPDAREEFAADTTDLDGVTEFVRKFLPGLEDKPNIVETCITTESPDRHFVIDTHPRWKNIVFGVGFSGHGFMVAPVIGKILYEMAIGQKLSYDITPFRMSRFSENAAKARL